MRITVHRPCPLSSRCPATVRTPHRRPRRPTGLKPLGIAECTGEGRVPDGSATEFIGNQDQVALAGASAMPGSVRRAWRSRLLPGAIAIFPVQIAEPNRRGNRRGSCRPRLAAPLHRIGQRDRLFDGLRGTGRSARCAVDARHHLRRPRRPSLWRYRSTRPAGAASSLGQSGFAASSAAENQS